MTQKISFLIFVTLLTVNTTKSQDLLSTFYISPGISISWGGNSNVLFGWKLSIGYMESEETYYNLTFGKKTALSKGEKEILLEYNYLEIQAGSFLGYYPLSAGGSFGITLSQDKIEPRLSLFGGALFFLNLDYTLNIDIVDLGVSINLPVPFNKEFRNLGPG